MLLFWLLVVALAGAVYYIAYNRFHIRTLQLVEMTFYPILALIFLYEWLRFTMTKRSKMEETWPRPVPYISPAEDRKQVEQARENKSVLLGYDIYGEPVTWSNETRTYQANCFGMTGGGKSCTSWG